jgi:hypothetical protein
MRAVSARRPALSGPATAHLDWWPQAGLSFAYRLAHLSVLRPVTVCAVALAFYFG